MKTIVITSPDHWSGEETVIPRLLEAGVDFVHLRKPAWSEADCARLLSLVPAWCHGRIVVHDHFALCRRFALRGIHLNGRCPEIPVGFEGAVSRSCHSLCEVEEGKPLSSYVFLSPVSTASPNRATGLLSRPPNCKVRPAGASSTGAWWPSAVCRWTMWRCSGPAVSAVWHSWERCGDRLPAHTLTTISGGLQLSENVGGKAGHVRCKPPGPFPGFLVDVE